MQLIAYGSQDAYLTGNPQITFFKTMYKRYTNFAVEPIAQTFNGTANFGRKVNTVISRNGDLISNMWLQVKLPKVNKVGSEAYRYCPAFGNALLRTIELQVGGQKIDKHYSDYLEILKQLTVEESKQAGFDAFADPASADLDPSTPEVDDKYMYIPLQFFFCRNIGLALPLIALQYHEVRVDIEFEEASKLFMYQNENESTWNAGIKSGDSVDLTEVELFVDYIFLDTEERRRYAAASHEYLVEQLQHTGPETWSNNSQKIRLNFNHPVKALYWVMQDEDEEAGNPLKSLDKLHRMKIQLNGQDRFSPRPGSYFRYIQPYQAHTRVPTHAERAIYVYSFGLNPEQHQPSGTCNFSRIDTAMMHLDTDTQGVNSGRIKIFATNYNVVRISSGMLGVAYAN